MGTDVNAKLAIGFEVSRNDFIDSRTSDKPMCANGHPRKDTSTAKFCSKDGTMFAPRTLESLSKTGERLIKAFNLDPPDKEWDIDEWWTFTSTEEPFVTAGTDEEHLLIGIHLADSGSIRGNPSTEVISFKDLYQAFNKVEEYRDKLGLSEAEGRAIKLYSWLRVSC